MQKAYAELAVLAAGGSVVRPARMIGPGDYQEVAELMIQMGGEQTRQLVRWPA